MWKMQEGGLPGGGSQVVYGHVMLAATAQGWEPLQSHGPNRMKALNGRCPRALPTVLGDRYYSCPHFVEEETELQGSTKFTAGRTLHSSLERPS